MLDYGAREYDPVLARWTTTDPLADMYWNHSPYSYCLNNPVNFTDPNGCAPVAPKEWERINSAWVAWGINDPLYDGYVYIDPIACIGKKTVTTYEAAYLPNIVSFKDRYFRNFGTIGTGSIGGGSVTSGGGVGNPFYPTAQEVIDAAGNGLSVAGWWMGRQDVNLTPFKDSNVPKPKKPSLQKLKSATPAKPINVAKIGKGLGFAGNALGAIGTLSSGYEAYEGWIEGDYEKFASATFDTVTSIIGMIGPWGLGASLVLTYAVKPLIPFEELN